MTNLNTVASYERILVEPCMECNSTSHTMFRLRNGFTVSGVVCERCFNMYYKKNRKPFLTFSRATDTAVSTGILGVKETGAWMRTSTYSNFVEPKTTKKTTDKKKKNHTVLKYSMEAIYCDYILDSSEEIITMGLYRVIEYKNRAGEQLKCYYTLHDNKPVARYIMNSSGMIIIHF